MFQIRETQQRAQSNPTLEGVVALAKLTIQTAMGPGGLGTSIVCEYIEAGSDKAFPGQRIPGRTALVKAVKFTANNEIDRVVMMVLCKPRDEDAVNCEDEMGFYMHQGKCRNGFIMSPIKARIFKYADDYVFPA